MGLTWVRFESVLLAAKAAVLSSSREWPPLPSSKRAELQVLFDAVIFKKPVLPGGLHKALRWRPWPMVFLSPERIIRLDLSFQDAGYRNATHWHRQLLGLLDQAHVPQAQEAAAFPPPVLFGFDRVS
mgnify:CR=1 FL=1